MFNYDLYNEKSYDFIEQKFMENDPMNPNNPYARHMEYQDQLKFHHENMMQQQTNKLNPRDAAAALYGVKTLTDMVSGAFDDMMNSGYGMLPM